MSIFEPSRSPRTGRMLSVLRIVAGLIFVSAGTMKLFGFVLAGEMAVAYFQFHFPQSPFPTVNNGIPAVLYCFIFLYFVFAGGGVWSLDALGEGCRHRNPRFQSLVPISSPGR